MRCGLNEKKIKMNRRNFIKSGFLSSMAFSINPSLTFQDNIENEITDCIHKCIDYIQDEYHMSFNEYKTPFVFNYPICEERLKRYNITKEIELQRSIKNKLNYDFVLAFTILDHVSMQFPKIDYEHYCIFNFTFDKNMNVKTAHAYIQNGTCYCVFKNKIKNFIEESIRLH